MENDDGSNIRPHKWEKRAKINKTMAKFVSLELSYFILYLLFENFWKFTL